MHVQREIRERFAHVVRVELRLRLCAHCHRDRIIDQGSSDRLIGDDSTIHRNAMSFERGATFWRRRSCSLIACRHAKEDASHVSHELRYVSHQASVQGGIVTFCSGPRRFNRRGCDASVPILLPVELGGSMKRTIFLSVALCAVGMSGCVVHDHHRHPSPRAAKVVVPVPAVVVPVRVDSKPAKHCPPGQAKKGNC